MDGRLDDFITPSMVREQYNVSSLQLEGSILAIKGTNYVDGDGATASTVYVPLRPSGSPSANLSVRVNTSEFNPLLPSLVWAQRFILYGGTCGDRYVGASILVYGSRLKSSFSETGPKEEFPADCGFVIPGGKAVALLASDGRVGLYSISTKKRIATLSDRWQRNALFTPLPDGSGLLISGQRKIENVKHQNELPFQITYSTRNGKVLKRKSTWVGDNNYGGGRYDLAQAVGFSSDGRFETGIWTRQGEYGAKKHFRVTRWGSTKKGCHLTSVSRGSAASSLGLRAGDTLTSGPCYKVPQILERSRAGERVTLRFTRSGKTYSRTLRLKPTQALGVQAEQRSVATDLTVDGDPTKISLSPNNSIAALLYGSAQFVELRWTGLGDYEF